MPKYEIMLLVDPKADLKNIESLVREVFNEDVKKFEKLERTELAYPINNSSTAQYALVEVETQGENIKEFTRKANIEKTLWRNLVVNLDSERQLDSLKHMDKVREFRPRTPRPEFSRREPYVKHVDRTDKPQNLNEEE